MLTSAYPSPAKKRAYYALNAPQKAQISVAKEAMNMCPHPSKMPTANQSQTRMNLLVCREF
ncbi:MAG: hypothetical protein SPH77_04430 [Campylobacter sp.]|uniref:hypothetical protein n=1 Tax=Campylobacter sp. TaxID=205 RepID=UPI002A546CD1|nr:hypothetical protein [Campylobacter sp.]MDD7091266.1 hypothetical protein [Campylobacteraceae bacterium]MDY3246720.1 hypothetical protein [Campylobacter sp.]MDY3663654.1 hypothetical protein [Campylobacter sp.]MDY5285350.1 hypothetical protein [Campylobacter sp.]MDY6188061.1 hypothetical protein [Campylobacter sp.]